MERVPRMGGGDGDHKQALKEYDERRKEARKDG